MHGSSTKMQKKAENCKTHTCAPLRCEKFQAAVRPEELDGDTERWLTLGCKRMGWAAATTDPPCGGLASGCRSRRCCCSRRPFGPFGPCAVFRTRPARQRSLSTSRGSNGGGRSAIGQIRRRANFQPRTIWLFPQRSSCSCPDRKLSASILHPNVFLPEITIRLREAEFRTPLLFNRTLQCAVAGAVFLPRVPAVHRHRRALA